MQARRPTAKYFIGMLSGTSRDGADLALVSFADGRPKLEQALCLPYPEPTAEALRTLVESARRPDTGETEKLHRETGEFFAAGVMQLLQQTGLQADDISAIGSHGQTIWHEPPESIQVGDPGIIAETTGIPTVGDFRQADLDAGGQGAPLAPLLHRALFRPESGRRAILNLGGIANLTFVDADGTVSGFDTGPGNCLLDAWIRRHQGESFDRDGRWAAGGRVIPPLLMTLLDDPWFSHLPPKSTGVEYFNLRWLEKLAEVDAFQAVDIQATLAELTARSIAAELPPDVSEVLVCGGGVHNEHLMTRLRAQRPDCRFETTATAGIDPDTVEAMLFAWLARERLAQRTQDTRSITGARQAVLLGTVYPPG